MGVLDCDLGSALHPAATMRNLWLDLPQTSPYVLQIDRDAIDAFAAKAVGEKKLNLRSIPEPFIGNPFSASVILLNLNPGDSADDAKAHADPAFREAMLRNLRHEAQAYPFYPLNPAFAWTPCGKWWSKHLHELWDVGGLDRAQVARCVCVIEWFPYHSTKSGLPAKAICESQKYSFDLARMALDNKKLIIGMRSKKKWAEVDPQLVKIPYLNSPQSGAVSRHNCPPGVFDEIVEALMMR